MHRYTGSFGKSLHYAPLTLTTLAALVPEELLAEVVIYDETAGAIPWISRPTWSSSPASREPLPAAMPMPTISEASIKPWCWGASIPPCCRRKPPSMPTW